MANLRQKFGSGSLPLMLVAVVSYAVIPALIGAIGGDKMPFFFLTAWRMGVAAGCLIVLSGFIALWVEDGRKFRHNFKVFQCDFKKFADNADVRARKWMKPFGKSNGAEEPAGEGKEQFRIFAKWPFLVGILILILGNCDYALFAWSFQHVNIAVTAAVFGTWVIIRHALSPVKTLQEGDDPEGPKFTQWVLLLVLIGLGLIGYFFIISSEIRTWDDFGNIEVVKKVAAGFSLAIGAMILTQFKELGPNVGKDWNAPPPDGATPNGDSGNGLSDDATPNGDSRRNVLLFGLLLISSLGASLLSTVVGAALGEHRNLNWEALGWAFAGGLFVNTFAGFVGRITNTDNDANGTGTDDGSNRTARVFGVILPVSVLLFLVVFQLVDSYVDIQDLAKNFSDLRLEYFILGYTTIVAASLIIQFKDDIRWSFEALILALGGCGTFVYFRDDLLDWLLGKGQWIWTGDGYFGSVALVATVFTLLLAFRVARLVTRSNDEENRTFSLLRKAERLTREEGFIDPRVLQCILKIDKPKNQEDLKENYNIIRDYIKSAKEHPGFLSESNRQALSEVEAELDMLVNSKKNISVLGEIFALLVFAGVTISLALFTIPAESRPWIRLLLDLFAMLVSSVVIFLVIYSVDLDSVRDDFNLDGPTNENEDYSLRFPNIGERLFEQYIAVIGGAAIIVVYAVLLADQRGVWNILPGAGF